METTTTFFENIMKIKYPWHITRVSHDNENGHIDLYVEHAKDIEFRCPKCKEFRPIYDHASERAFRHLNIFDFKTFIHVRVPRLNCPVDGVILVDAGLAEPNSGVTHAFERFIIDLSLECSIESVARLFDVDWHLCQRIQERAVARGRERKGTVLPAHLGVDEKSFARGHKYETVIYDTKRGIVDDVLENREQSSLETYYKKFPPEARSTVETVSMDMWDPYIAATKACIPGAAEKIVFDHYHVTQLVLQGVDKVRKAEHQELMERNIETLKGTKYIWLWNEENVPEFRQAEYDRLKSLDLKVCRAKMIKDNLRHLWKYKSAAWMKKYFASWYFWATHSRLKPMIAAARSLKAHLDNILTYAKHQVTNAMGESINSKIEKMKRLACGFRNREHYRIAILFHCGGLDLYPRPENVAHPVLAVS